MTKETYDSFISALQSVDVKEYVIRCEGGNRMVYHNGKTSFVFAKDDHIEAIEITQNYAVDGGQFDVICVPYENIDTVKAVAITFEQGIKLMEALGNSGLDEFFSKTPIRQDIKPGTANLAAMKDGKGNNILPPGTSGYVV